MSEAEKTSFRWRKILLCPATWLAFFWCVLALLGFVPLLPTSGEGALDREGFLVFAGFIFLLLSLGFALVSLLSRKVRGRKKAGKTLLYLFLAFLWLSLEVFLIGRANECVERIACGSNLKSIYLSMEQYAADYDGFFPPELKTLHDSGYLSDDRVYRCTSRTRPNAEFSDYLYFGRGRKLKEPPFLLMRDRDGNHPGVYRNNLYSNGQVLPEP
ncbi:MAG: hypothetical protein BWY31_04628 [Lentisphaerae bacterium ADurb.Bin242]|nr:MAG: hypothetical protein BWY31_04628 [Lentisphaerae bacterium ADurb.Bin242]